MRKKRIRHMRRVKVGDRIKLTEFHRYADVRGWRPDAVHTVTAVRTRANLTVCKPYWWSSCFHISRGWAVRLRTLAGQSWRDARLAGTAYPHKQSCDDVYFLTDKRKRGWIGLSWAEEVPAGEVEYF